MYNETSKILQKRNEREATERDEKKRAELVLDILPPIEFERIVDLGCGLGTCMKLLKSKGVGKEIIGLDVYVVGKKINPELDIREYDLNELPLPFRDGEFDLIIATGVLQHTFYPRSILKEMKRILRNSGYAVIGLSNAYHIINRKDILFGKPVSEYGLDRHGCHYFTNIQENRTFVQSEFKIIKELNQFISGGKAGLLAKIIRYGNLFSRHTIFLCKK